MLAPNICAYVPTQTFASEIVVAAAVLEGTVMVAVTMIEVVVRRRARVRRSCTVHSTSTCAALLAAVSSATNCALTAWRIESEKP